MSFAHHVLYSSNYFVLISRADFPNLPYSVDEIYKIKTSGNTILSSLFIKIAGIIVMLFPGRRQNRTFLSFYARDSKSGFQFFERHFADSVSLPALRP